MATVEKYKEYNQDNDIKIQTETVLVNQGGGSLGAYECGVSKALARYEMKFDIIAGSSIGAINAAILASNYSNRYGIKYSVKKLEDFWLELGEKMMPFCSDKQKSELAALSSLFWGNSKAFTPLWVIQGGNPFYYFFTSPYLYEVSSLRNTIKKYVDFSRLQKTHKRKIENDEKSLDEKQSRNDLLEKNNDFPRLIMTATNIQSGEPVTFDSDKIEITLDHIIASAGYAIYGLPWTKIDNNYFWDGSFVHNTPLKAIVEASPKLAKIVYVSDVFPLEQKKLPNSMPETYHRVRDLLFHDISINQINEVSNIIKEHLSIIEQMRDIILECKDKDKDTKSKFKDIEKEYQKLLANRKGFVISKLVHIQRQESKNHHFLFEDADFSIATIERLIKEGEMDTENTLLKINEKEKINIASSISL
jgi:NTE family protein